MNFRAGEFQQEIDILAGHLCQSRSPLFFTGAGISTGSGIPDFRGPNGLWKKWKPVYFDEFMRSREARIRHWEFKLFGWEGFRNARPNPAHRALADLEKMGHLARLVTQNIDGLHQKAGNSPDRVIELHGTNLLVECVRCGRISNPEPVYREFAETREPPLCEECEGFLKPATVSFGQQMPMDRLEKAFEAAREADLVVSVGSTLEVEPAASVPGMASRSGAFYAVINLGATAHDHLADLRFEVDSSDVLPRLVERVRVLES